MINSLVRLPAISFVLLFFTAFSISRNDQCEGVTVTPRGQDLLIKHPGCSWVRIEYSTTDWRCKGGNCEEIGTVTWHVEKIDTKQKDKAFYYQVARGPKNVSHVGEANVLDCQCQ